MGGNETSGIQPSGIETKGKMDLSVKTSEVKNHAKGLFLLLYIYFPKLIFASLLRKPEESSRNL